MVASADSVLVYSRERGQGEIVSIGHKKLVQIRWLKGGTTVVDKQTACAMVRRHA